jgi:hypothetical protein
MLGRLGGRLPGGGSSFFHHVWSPDRLLDREPETCVWLFRIVEVHPL